MIKKTLNQLKADKCSPPHIAIARLKYIFFLKNKNKSKLFSKKSQNNAFMIKNEQKTTALITNVTKAAKKKLKNCF